MNELKILHELTFELLKEFKLLCQKMNVKYYLSGGTLLGAVRHKGFIPWDDDADVMMLRKDYQKLINEQKKYLDISKFQILSAYDNTYPRDFARFVRKDYYKTDDCVDDDLCPYLGIDIFPVDFVPNNNLLFCLVFYFLNPFKRLVGIYGSRRGTGASRITILLRNILRPFVKIIGGYRIAKFTQYLESICNLFCTKSVAALSGINGKKEKWLYSEYEPECLLKFEGEEFLCPLNYHIYLKNLYGDYMKLPPENKRKAHGIKIIKMDED